MGNDVAWLRGLIRDVPDYPHPGVVFKDITPLLADPKGLTAAVEALTDLCDGDPIDQVVGVEARGFITAAPVAYLLGAGFVPVRKAGKLPRETHTVAYDLEYGEDTIEVSAVDGAIMDMASGASTGGTGGMASKLESARIASWSGVPTVIRSLSSSPGSLK